MHPVSAMVQHDWLPIIGQMFAAVPSCAAAFTAWMSYRSSLANRRELVSVAAKVEAVHIATNSLTDRLVASTDSAAHARGLAEGSAAQAALNEKASAVETALADAHAEGRQEAEAEILASDQR